jgi:hypothetical protein
MKVAQVLTELKKLGSEQTKKTLLRHGGVEPLYGVKVEDLKKLLKKLKPNHPLALELYDSGIGDAMYLAALLCDPKEMTLAQLDAWAKKAPSPMIGESAVAWVAAESRFAMPAALKWIDAKQPHVATSGWSTLSSYVAVTPDEALDVRQLQALLNRVGKDVAKAPNRVKACMNSFVIAVGTHVKPLSEAAVALAKKLGKVEVDVGDTACKIPVAAEYIAKAHAAGKLGTKRKTAFC